MPREHPMYRKNLELLNEKYPDVLMLTMEQAKKVWGCKSSDTMRKILTFSHGRVSKADMARAMCGEG